MADKLIAVDDQTGKKRLIAVPSGIDPTIQTFTANGTWTKPANCKQVRVILIGGGGGGGSGMFGTSGSQCGGGGGSGGGYVVKDLLASDLPSTVSVTVGSGGSGGVAVTQDGYNGKDGSDGGTTSFGTYAKAFGGKRGFGGSRWKTGRLDFFVGAGGDAQTNSVRGGNAKIGIGESAADTINAPSSGGAGGGISTTSQGGGTGGTAQIGPGGNGGAGGFGRITGAGDAGISGSTYGGGGGGGGASKGTGSGAGGNGAAGICIVVSY